MNSVVPATAPLHPRERGPADGVGTVEGDRELSAVARGSALNLVTAVIGAALGLVMIVVVARTLGASGAGVFFGAIAIFTIVAAGLELGAQAGLIRTITSYRERGSTHEIPRLLAVAIVPVVVLGTIAAVVVVVLAEPIARIAFSEAHQADAVRYLRVLGPFLPLAAGASVALSGTRAFGSMVSFVLIRNLGKPLLRPLLTVAAILAGLGSTAIALAWGLPAGLEFPIALVALALVLRRRDVRVEAGRPVRSRRAIAREFWYFAAPRGLAMLFQMTVLWLSVVLVGALASASEAGIYGAASRLIVVGTLAIEAVRLAISPQIGAALARDDLRGAQRLYQLGTWWLMTPSWPAYVLMAVFAPTFLAVFGEGFVDGQHVLVVLSLAMLVNIGTGNVTVVLLMAGKTTWNLQIATVSVVINVTLNLLLIPRFGMMGAAIAWAVTIAWDNLVPLARLYRYLGLHPFGPGWATVAAASIACFGGIGLAIRVAAGDGPAALTAAVVLAGAVYAAVIWRARRVLRLDVVATALRPGRAAASPDASPEAVV